MHKYQNQKQSKITLVILKEILVSIEAVSLFTRAERTKNAISLQNCIAIFIYFVYRLNKIKRKQFT